MNGAGKDDIHAPPDALDSQTVLAAILRDWRAL
jgi:hypothetical protein